MTTDPDAPLTTAYRRPLVVYVVWHPASERCGQLADAIFNELCQDPTNPLEWNLQIPVRFRSKPGLDQDFLPGPIPLDESDPASARMTAIVVLVDNKMLLDRTRWGPYVAAMSKACGDPQGAHRFFPVMVSDSAHKLDPAIAEDQFIRIPKDHAQATFLNRLTHELCRMAMNKPRAPLGMVHRRSPGLRRSACF